MSKLVYKYESCPAYLSTDQGTLMSDLKHRQMLAKLTTQLAINNAQIMSNPKPYLDYMSEACYELLKVIEDIEYALSPDYVFDVWDCQVDKEIFSSPQDIQGEAFLRCNKALEVISAYRQKK